MTVDYPQLRERIEAVVEHERDPIALMATIACEVLHADDRFDWVGFYRVVGPDTLKIGPYQGGHGCLTIQFSRGICGRCARERAPQIIPDVHAEPDHIACSSTTRSELALPVFGPADELIGVFDIDSNLSDAFHKSDADEFTSLLTVFQRP